MFEKRMVSRLERDIFFICGVPKSGTTWLQRVLNSHPRIICKGEGHFIERFVLPMVEVFRKYNSQLSIASDQVYQGRPYYEVVNNEEFYEYCDLFISSSIEKDEKKNSVIIGDKTPMYYKYIKNIKNIYPKAKIIYIFRDPRDISVSRVYHAHRSGVEDALENNSNNRMLQIEATIRQFKDCVQSFNAASILYEDDILSTSYESMSSNAKIEVTKILNFLGVYASEDQRGEIITKNSFEAITKRKNGMMDAKSFERKGIVGDWKNELSPSEEKFIRERIPEDLRMGYF